MSEENCSWHGVGPRLRMRKEYPHSYMSRLDRNSFKKKPSQFDLIKDPVIKFN